VNNPFDSEAASVQYFEVFPGPKIRAFRSRQKTPFFLPSKSFGGGGSLCFS
jgi:hypothetical protein